MTMTPKYNDSRVLEIVGVLDEDENGKHVIKIETKDETIIKDFDEILDSLGGTMISFKVVENIG
jgi:hypothetical protein